VGGNGGGTAPAGSDPGADRPQGQRARPNWPMHWPIAPATAEGSLKTVSEPGESPIAPVTAQGSPQTVSEPGESPKEGSPSDAYHSFSTEPTIVQKPHRIVQKTT